MECGSLCPSFERDGMYYVLQVIDVNFVLIYMRHKSVNSEYSSGPSCSKHD